MATDAHSNPADREGLAAARFDRDGETVYNLTLRVTGSPGAAWHATVAAFAAVAERIPADAPEGADQQDLLLMGSWHARQLLGQLEANPEYAAQLRAHDEANVPMASLQASVVRANEQLPVDQREVLALRGLSRLDHQDLAALLRADPSVLAAMLAQARLMLRDAMRGSTIAADALASDEDREAVALAALRQDGQLRGAEARLTLAQWLEGDGDRRSVVDALEEAGLSYRAWARASVPDGLRDAAVGAAAGVAPAAPVDDAGPASDAPAAEEHGAGDPGATAADPYAAAAHPSEPAAADVAPAEPHGAPGDPAAGAPVEHAYAPAEPRDPAAAPHAGATDDPHATVEWTAGDIAALGLEDDGEEWDDDWDDDEHHGDDEDWDDDGRGRGRPPRWQVAVVGVLLVALVVLLALTFLKDDEPTEPQAPASDTTEQTETEGDGTTTRRRSTTTRDSGSLPSPYATIVIRRL
ncbi:MAG: hypothetical protein M0P31_09340 [Solirubrobacteraceae bacterium]|nr:hypothetical protein [Solirubrobacteraceae bacterium]